MINSLKYRKFLSILFLIFLFHFEESFGKRFIEDPKVSIVVIDPGHGGKDPGAVVANAREKDIVLDISLKLGNLISQNFQDVKVLYTRKTDVFVPLNKRALVANKNHAVLFISIHANYAESSSVKGTETFTLGLHRSQENLEVAKKENSVILLEDDYEKTYEGFDPSQAESYIMFENIQEAYSEQSIVFASEIQNQFRISANRNDRSVKQAGFIVLREAAMPSVLVEVGFLSNDTERNYLLSDQGKTEIALSLFQSFKNHKRLTENRSTFYNPENKNLNQTENNTESDQELSVKNKVENETIISATDSNEQNITEPVQKTKNINNNKEQEIFYAYQISALSKQVDTKSANFKDEKDIFMVKVGNFYKYYCGKSLTLQDAGVQKARISGKFRGAFLVKFENGNITPVKF